MLFIKYRYITKCKSRNLLSGKCKVIYGKDFSKRLVVKIDDDLEKTLLFVNQILRSNKFEVVHCFVKPEQVNKILDCDVLIKILFCSNYRFNMTFNKKDDFVELYRIEKIKDGCYFG
ncbi:hypothetical protein BDAP_000943 [Binucleata daphniae]